MRFELHWVREGSSDPSDSGSVFLGEGERITVGRKDGADIVLPDEKVSRLHASIFMKDGAVVIEDAGSSNGIVIDGSRVARAHWKPGQSARIGPFRFDLVIADDDRVPVQATASPPPSHSAPSIDAPSGEPKRYRAFISYSQKDKGFARRLHRALESYRIPAGVRGAPQDRRLGRFFRDDEEMGASRSLGAALKGALSDAEALIVLCSPDAARSTWVDAEVRHFKSRQDGRVYAVILDGEPNAAQPERECFPPSLKVRIGSDGRPTGEPDEPRAPDLRREGLARVRAQLAAGLLDVPFDDLWQRDRRRLRWRQTAWAGSGVALSLVLGVFGIGWHDAQRTAQQQAAQESVVRARSAVADGRTADALKTLSPFLRDADTAPLVQEPVRTLLRWVPDPTASLRPGTLQPVRLRDATVLIDPGQGAYDISDVGLKLRRLIRASDGVRIVAIGDQRTVALDARSGARTATLDNKQMQWVGHAFEARSGLLIVTGGIFGPTNGSVWPYVLSVSADGSSLRPEVLDGNMFFRSAVGVTAACDALLFATRANDTDWSLRSRALAAQGISPPDAPSPLEMRASRSEQAAVAQLAKRGPAALPSSVFMARDATNPFTVNACVAVRADESDSGGAALTIVDVTSAGAEPFQRWRPASAPKAAPKRAPFRGCTEAKPCPVVEGSDEERYERNELPAMPEDRSGWLPVARWSGREIEATPVFYEYLYFNSGHRLALCRPASSGTTCLVRGAMGEDHAGAPLLRSADGRFLYWPFGGVVLDTVELKLVTPMRGIPLPEGEHHDFELDREGLTVVSEGQLITYRPDKPGGAWERQEDGRASPRYGVLEPGQGGAVLQVLASLGKRQYLAVRSDGALARLDARSGIEVWRTTASRLGKLRAVELDAERRHALLIGENAWRVYNLADGFPLSGLLVPPGLRPEESKSEQNKRAECELLGSLQADGSMVASCGGQVLAWQPGSVPPDGELSALAERLSCPVDPGASAMNTIKRCYLAGGGPAARKR